MNHFKGIVWPFHFFTEDFKNYSYVLINKLKLNGKDSTYFVISNIWFLRHYNSTWKVPTVVSGVHSLHPSLEEGLKVALLIQNKYPWPKCPKTNQTSNKQIQNKYISWFAVAIQVEWSGQGYRNSGVENLGEKAYWYRAVNVRYAPNLSRKIDHGHKNTQPFT